MTIEVTDFVDVVVGLQYGDEGKGKIVSGISEQLNYEITARYNGGSNAGHTVNLSGAKQLKLHQIPSSIAYKKRGYIGPGCLINCYKLEAEALHFKSVMGFHPYEYLNISPKAIVVTEKHLDLDKRYHANSQGSTSSGVAPAYSDFYNRTASLAEDFSWPSPSGEEMVKHLGCVNNMLLEGAQGHYLNPYQGNYPYTTSSSCHPAQAASSFGFSPKLFRNIIGIAKCYETRSGIDPDFAKVLKDGFLVEPSNDYVAEYAYLQEKGKEFGVTTGRRRNIRFLDLSRLIQAVNSTGTNILVLQKWDILEGCPNKGYYYNGVFSKPVNLQEEVESLLFDNCKGLDYVLHSASPMNDIDWTSIL